MSHITPGFRYSVFFGLLGLCASVAFPVLADVKPDRSLGTRVESRRRVDLIREGTRRGANVFHSFREFSIDSGREARFIVDSGIENILSRVTGNQRSLIQGTLSVNGLANLFLLNPNGIIFGQDAQLDLNGSFIASTANSLRLRNGGVFDTNRSNELVLINTNPIALRFASNDLDPNAGGILVERASLDGAEGQTLALIGRSVDILGSEVDEFSNLSVSEGHIELAGLGNRGNRVGLSNHDGLINFDYSRVNHFGDMRLREAASVDGEAASSVSLRAGNIVITSSDIDVSADAQQNGGDLDLNASENIIIENDSELNADILGEGDRRSRVGGDISLQGETIEIEDSSLVTAAVRKGAVGNGGNIRVNATELFVEDGSRIRTSTSGTGDAGDINIEGLADGSRAQLVEISDIDPDEGLAGASALLSNVEAGSDTGNGGDISVKTRRLVISDRGQITASTSGSGNTGQIRINARKIQLDGDTRPVFSIRSELIPITLLGGVRAFRTVSYISYNDVSRLGTGIFTRVNEDSEGRAYRDNSGNPRRDSSISIRTQTLSIRDSALIATDTRAGGRGGTATIEAARSITLRRGALLTANTSGEGRGGNISLDAGVIDILEDATVSAASAGQGDAGTIDIDAGRVRLLNSELLTDVGRSRNREIQAGSVTINAGSLSMDNASILVDTFNTDNKSSGTLSLNVRNRLLIAGGSVLSASAERADAGNIAIDTGSLQMNNGQIIAETRSDGDGGNVTLTIRNPGTTFIQNNSLISATAGTNDSPGEGGNITINARGNFFVTGADNNDILANAFSDDAGRIDLTGRAILGTDEREDQTIISDITASSEFANDGVITLAAVQIEPTRELTEFPQEQPVRVPIARGCPTARGQSAIRLYQGRSESDQPFDPAFDSPPSNLDEPNPASIVIEAQGWVEENGVYRFVTDPAIAPQSSSLTTVASTCFDF